MASNPIKIQSFLIFTLSLVTLLPLISSLSSVAISETGNQTLICSLTQSIDPASKFLNCTIFPQRTQIQLNPPFSSISGIVGGNGFICALSSFYSSNTSIIVCWRFLNIESNLSNYSRVYIGPVLTELSSGSSHICGLVSGSSSVVQCWQWSGFGFNGVALSSNLAVGEDFVCGLSGLGEVRCLGSDRNVVDRDRVPSGVFSRVSAGLGNACGVSVNGSLLCWGNVTVESPRGEFTDVVLGEGRGCAVRRNETVVCWGEGGFSLPESLREESFIAIEAKRRVFCGVATSNYSLICWGSGDFDSNPLVLSDVVPGSCRTSDQCGCGSLPNYGVYCAEGLMICRPCVQRPPEPETPQPASPPSSTTRSSRKWDNRMVAFLVVGCVGSFSSLVVLFAYIFSRYFKIRGSRIHDSGRLEEGGSPSQTAEPPLVPPSVLEKKLSHLISMGNGGHLEEFPFEVLLQVTDNFSQEHKIGTGSFGSVYHATLDDGREVAVKRAESSTSASDVGANKRGQDDKDNAFLNELEFLSRLNHKNLVRLFGYCEDRNERILVYEYVNNGTLSDHLHKLQSSPLMSWTTRIKVALDAARGIEYLHKYAVPSVIHRDIKSSNILLDAAWNAKVSDFGLSLLGPQDDKSHLSLHAAGTMGYMDPEYYRLQVLTTKSDVYSFGIVLLELLSGCKAIHKNENGVPRNVVDYVIPYIIQDEVHRVLDRRVPPPTPFEIEGVAYVGYLAADCVMPEGRHRPTMSEVVDSLDRALGVCTVPPALSRSTTDSST